MVGLLTVADMMKIVRFNTGIYDKRKLLDGYAADLPRFAEAPSILVALQLTLNDLCRTGFNKCNFAVELQPDVSEYLFTRQAHDILSQNIYDTSTERYFPLLKKAIPDLDSTYGGQQWRHARGSRPVYYYPVGTRGVGFYPIPSLENLVANFLAEAVVAPLTAATDVPGMVLDAEDAVILEDDGLPFSSLPEEYHELVPLGASARIARSLGDNEKAGSLFYEYAEGKKELKTLVNGRQEVDMKALEIRTPRYRTGARSSRSFVRG